MICLSCLHHTPHKALDLLLLITTNKIMFIALTFPICQFRLRHVATKKVHLSDGVAQADFSKIIKASFNVLWSNSVPWAGLKSLGSRNMNEIVLS